MHVRGFYAHTFNAMEKPMSHEPLDLPKPKTPTARTESRDTFFLADGSSKALERVGQMLEGDDGKAYVGSFAVHVYATGGALAATLGPPEYVTAAHVTDLTRIPESIARHAMVELSRAVMVRYGRKPPARRDDITETSRTI